MLFYVENFVYLHRLQRCYTNEINLMFLYPFMGYKNIKLGFKRVKHPFAGGVGGQRPLT